MRRGRFTGFNGVALGLGLLFLWAPLALVVLYSFNESRLVTLWGGWSLRWYGALAGNAALLDAAFVSLKVALGAATLATILGTLAALALARRGRFAGRTAFSALLLAPMVMPEVVLGLSLLLLFVALGLDRGLLTVILAHATVAIPFVAAIVGARLARFDRDLERAAADLGASPAVAIGTVTLPVAAPAIAAAFLLAFTLSFDDLVIASFASGPGATTLPMRIYSSVRLGVAPDVNAAATLMITVVILGVGGSLLLARRR